MKKITITVSAKLAPSIISLVAEQASEIHMESVDSLDPQPVTRRSNRGLKDVRLTGVHKAILKHFTHEGRFTTETAAKWLVEEGYSSTSDSPTLTQLVAQGYVRKLPDRTGYAFVSTKNISDLTRRERLAQPSNSAR